MERSLNTLHEKLGSMTTKKPVIHPLAISPNSHRHAVKYTY